MPNSATKPRKIETLSDTARWVAAYRAVESARPDALFHDRFAAILAGSHGEEIVRSIPGGRLMGWTVVVRTRVLDEVILKAIRERGVDMVLNLAAGLDTRPYRLDLPPQLTWVEVDLPEIFTFKEAKLTGEKPVCKFERVKMDLSDAAARRVLFTRLNAEAKNVLVLTEGFLMYLTAEQVDQLAVDLCAQSNFQLWAQDYVSQPLLRALRVVLKGIFGRGNAEFKFLTREGVKFFVRRGWKVAEYHPSILDAQRLKREMPLGWVVRAADAISLWGLVRKSGGILLLERRTAPKTSQIHPIQ